MLHQLLPILRVRLKNNPILVLTTVGLSSLKDMCTCNASADVHLWYATVFPGKFNDHESVL